MCTMTMPSRSSLDFLMTETMREAAEEASIADGVFSSTGDFNVVPTKPKKQGLRRGKWTPEEEAYANRLIEDFKSGLLPLADGTTLRTFLSKLLNCDPMRISKKYVGNNCIGKQVYRRRQDDIDTLSADLLERHGLELAELERKFHDRLKQGGRSKSAQKASRDSQNDTVRAKSVYPLPGANFAVGNGSSDRTLTTASPLLPWITPGQVNPPDNNDFSAPYAMNGHTTMGGFPSFGDVGPAQPWQQQREQKSLYSHPGRGSVDSMEGTGTGRGLSDFDALNYPDAFASSSSLDILGTLAEIKLPSATSLENLQKFGIDASASTSSLTDWYSSLGGQKSTGDLPMQFGAVSASDCSDYCALQSNVGAGGGVYFHRGTGVTSTGNPTGGSGGNGSKFSTTVWRGVNGEILHPDSFLGASSRSAGKGGGAWDRSGSMSDSDEFGMKHSLSRELLDVVAAAANYEKRNGSDDTTTGGANGESMFKRDNGKSESGASRLKSSPWENSPEENSKILMQMKDLPKPDTKVLMSSLFQQGKAPSFAGLGGPAVRRSKTALVPAPSAMGLPHLYEAPTHTPDRDSELHVMSSTSRDSAHTEGEHSPVQQDERKRKIAQLEIGVSADADIPVESLKVHRPSFL